MCTTMNTMHVKTSIDNNQHSESIFKKESGTTAENPWQERLLPLMIRMVVGVTLFFFVTSLAQLIYLHFNIQQAPRLDYSTLIEVSRKDSAASSVEFRALAMLEANIVERRYHQLNVILMSRVWARYLGFCTGMILAMVGAVFILGKLKEHPTEISAEIQGSSFALRSMSPGLIMAVLGVGLMVTTIVTHHYIISNDKAVYLGMYAEPEDTYPDDFLTD